MPQRSPHPSQPPRPGSLPTADDGTRCLRADGGKAVAELDLASGIFPPAGPAAVVTLASTAALAATTSALAPGRLPADRRPLTTQLCVNLFRETRGGTLTAEAETIYRGRTTLIVDVKVRDDTDALVATLVFTQLAPRELDERFQAPARLAS